MSNQLLRLRTIEVAMTPEQIVLAWLKSVLTSSSFEEASLASLAPRAYIANAVSTAISSATRGLDRNTAQQAIREAQQQADSLYLLAIAINVAVLECSQDRGRWMLMVGYLRTVMHVPEPQRCEVLPWLRSSIFLGFEDFLITEDAVNRVSREHFNGHELLFSDVKARFDEQRRSLDLVCKGFDFLAAGQGEETPIDLELYRGELKKEVAEQISRWRMLARLEMLDQFGEPDACRTQLETFLKSKVEDTTVSVTQLQ